MPRPPNEPYAELLALIEKLESEYRRMRNVNAQVSDDALGRLREIRADLLRVTPSRGRKVVLAVGKAVLAKLAIELIRWMLTDETSIYRFTAAVLRTIIYDCRRSNQNTPRVGGSEADRPRGTRVCVSVLDFLGRSGSPRADVAVAA
jgi:hypothetical protein